VSSVGALTSDDATVVHGERGGELAWPSLSRSPQSPLHLHCNGKGTKKSRGMQAIMQLFFAFEAHNRPFYFMKSKSHW